ncbi:unnamed protein product, partial [Staurois parvus]
PHQCHINATYQCLPVHINATYQCPAAFQCHLSMPISATYQCCQSVPPISAHQSPPNATFTLALCAGGRERQCRPSVPVSAAYQCHVSVLPFSAHQ